MLFIVTKDHWDDLKVTLVSRGNRKKKGDEGRLREMKGDERRRRVEQRLMPYLDDIEKENNLIYSPAKHR